MKSWTISANSLLLFLAILPSTNAQVVPDHTLPTNSVVTTQNNTSTITGGTRAGNNLFHSFQQFSVLTNETAYFNNAADIQNIIGRVTGGSVSNINGLMKINGTANLFLINPNGIIFGPNASLNIGGSFIATTASSLNFADGTAFNAGNPQSAPLLTVSIPIGLNFTSTPGPIQVQGIGHNLSQSGGFEGSVVGSGPIPSGIAVQPGHTLAFVGGDITFTGGIATALNGRIEVGSVNSGQVSINSNPSEGFSLGYEKTTGFQNILLEKKSLLNASGVQNGDIQVIGKNIQLTDASVIFISNLGLGSLGSINVRALNKLNLDGITPYSSQFPNTFSAILSQTFSGKGADINIDTKDFVLQNSANIASLAFNSARGGNIRVNATNSGLLLGTSPISPGILGSLIVTSSVGSGQAGDVSITTPQLSLQDGGELGSVTFGTSSGGNVIINVPIINENGYDPVSLISSTIASGVEGSGNAGKLLINSKQITLENGGRIDASTLVSGKAGDLTVNASDFIKIDGSIPGSDPSNISSSSYLINPVQRQVLNLPPGVSGTSGNIQINTNRLVITNGGQLSVKNDGNANGGSLQVNAASIELNNGGGITANTAQGEGGNISLRTNNLQLNQNSFISSSAGGNSNGGNISINTQLIPILDSSFISANAQGGTGGRVTINTQGLFLSPDSSITATSQRGPQFNGIVQVNVPAQLNFARASSTPTPPPQSPQVTSVCPSGTGSQSSLVNSGTGGTPPSADSMLNSNTTWQDNFTPVHKSRAAKPKKHSSRKYLPIPATGVAVYPDGTMAFVAANSSTPTGTSSGCREANVSQ